MDVELGSLSAPGRATRVGTITTAVDIEPPRRIDGDGSFTQEQFIAHYGGVDEWNAALPVQQNQNENEERKTWFFADRSDATVRHGPYTLTKLQRWLAKEQLESTILVRNGREGEDVELGSLS